MKFFLLKVIRWILGRIILLLNALTPPKSLKRSVDDQSKVDQETQSMMLYQFEACPFCVKVRRTIKRLGLKIRLKDAKRDCVAQEELLRGSGRVKVPCLKITQDDGSEKWMSESADIGAYLNQKFGA